VSEVLAVRGGLVVSPSGVHAADVLIDGEHIAAITPPGEASGATIDARGCVVLPGAVDAHVHVGLDYRRMDGTVTTSADGYEDASRAAAAGGTTTIIDFAMQVEGEGLLAPLERRLDDIRPSAVDVALHCWMLEANAQALREIPELVARGVPSLKVFLAYSQLGEPMPDEDLLAAWKAVAAAGGIMQAHCESWPIIRPRLAAAIAEGATGYAGFAASRPPLSEADAVGRALALAAASGAETYCVHLSTRGAVEHLRLARMHGLAVHGEACPHHLLLDESRYLGERPGDFVMSPPLRTAEHRAALWAGLIDGTIEVAAADHAAWPAPVKAPGPGFLEAVHGAAGNGLLLPLLAAQVGAVDGFAWEHVARVTAENPARIFRLPEKGALVPGRHADLVVLNPADVAPVPQVPPYWLLDNGIFRGLPHVPPRIVLQRGRVLARAGEFVGEDAAGEFVGGRAVL
jgi:dihydropyrimidinase